MKAITKILLDTRRKKINSEKYPVKLRVTFGKEQKYYPLNLDMTKGDFALVQNPGAIPKDTEPAYKKQQREWKLKCDTVLVNADQINGLLPDFNFRLFEKKMYKNKQSGTDVYSYYAETINRLRKNGRLGTASNYQCSMNSLKKFLAKLSFRDITLEFLKDYEAWLLTNGKSISTVGIYLRPLRAIINEAIDEGVISREINYAFGKRKYQIPAAKNIKKALTIDELKMIIDYEALPGTWFEKARDFFIFSYLCNGINIKDIALLKYKNIDGEYIHFTRAKTQHTNRTASTTISIFILDEISVIIERWKNKDTDIENYVFPILERDISAERELRLIQQFTKMVNRYIKHVTASVGISKQVTSYYARHSFATILRNSGAPTAFISESLGHTSTKTTESYLDSFESETKKKWAEKLTAFIK